MLRATMARVILLDACAHCRRRLRGMNIHIRHTYDAINALCVELPKKRLKELERARCFGEMEEDARAFCMMEKTAATTGAQALWGGGYTGKGINIAIVDTGLSSHPDFLQPENRVAAFADMMGGESRLYDDNGHGTFCAGVAAGSGAASDGKYRGVAPGASLTIVKAMDSMGGGSASSIAAALQWIFDHRRQLGTRVVSLSLGTDNTRQSSVMVRMAEALWEAGIVVVAAAGNSGPHAGTITAPGSSSAIITVGSYDDRGEEGEYKVADFSSRGPVGAHRKPDIVAPGVSIVSTLADKSARPGQPCAGRYARMSGTSVSTPIVAGLCALLLEKYPHMTPRDVKRTLMRGAHSLTGDWNSEGSGRVDISGL